MKFFHARGDFTEQHLLISQTAEEFAVNEIAPNIEKMEHKDFSITRDLLEKGRRTRAQPLPRFQKRTAGLRWIKSRPP